MKKPFGRRRHARARLTGAPGFDPRLPGVLAAALFSFACATSRPAPIDVGSVGHVRNECSRSSTWCSGFAEGLFDALAIDETFCAPPLTAETVRLAILDAIKGAPEDAAAVIYIRPAFEAAWGCAQPRTEDGAKTVAMVRP
jgi:hypothetical protein